jgi:hypothetical protein
MLSSFSLGNPDHCYLAAGNTDFLINRILVAEKIPGNIISDHREVASGKGFIRREIPPL